MIEHNESQVGTLTLDLLWDLQPDRPFSFTTEHSDWNRFQEYFQNIIGSLEKHCCENLTGDWLLTQCLWGQTYRTSNPIILLVFDTKK